ncbi:MAG: toll/interleukin-1 receptor domain-containing protein [Desulfococcaceae bacterium]
MTSSQIFLSFADQDKESARKLYSQLIQKNISVWFEPESLLPGQKREVMIREAIQNSRLFLVLLSSASVERGKVNKQVVQALDILDEFPENDIFVIPVRLNDCQPSHAKLKMIHSVDMFPNWDLGFQEIMRSIRAVFPRLPEAETAFAESLFDLFDTRQAVILLAQEGRNDMTAMLKKCGEERFGKANLLHLVPPSYPSDLKEYFSGLNESLQNVFSPVSFMAAVEKRLEQTRKLFLLITRFEQGNEKENQEFAGVLRSLLEKHPNLYILICGGEKLADLYFGGELSLLNASESVEMPENGFSGQYSDANTAERICHISGGHPKLTEECKRFYQKCPDFSEKQCKENLIRLPSVQHMFTPFKRSADVRQRVCALLENEDVEKFVTLDFSDPLIKRLYWKNLLKKSPDGKRLIWRCELLREIGRDILE